MGAGMEAWTPDGHMQISADFRNFHLRHKFIVNEPGTVIWEVAGQPSLTRMVERRFQAMTPIVASASDYSGKPVATVLVNEGNGNWLLRIYQGLQPLNGMACTVWIYDAGVFTRANYGFELLMPDGSLAFSTAGKPMRVIQVFPVRQGSVSTQHVVNVPAGRRYAAMVSRAWVYTQAPTGYRINGPSQNGVGPQEFRPAGASVTIPASGTQYNQLGMSVVVDVTGH